MLKRLTRHPVVQAALARLLGLYLAFAYRTTRWTLLGEAHLRAAFQPPGGEAGPVVAAFWHERLPLMAQHWLACRAALPAVAARRMHVLVSRHRDGRFIGAVVRRFRLEVLHASSTRGGATGLRGMLRVLAAGDCVVITPDGPRGPPRRAAPGVAHLAALSGRPVLPCAAATTRARRLRSWDRMLVPLPFARGVLVVGPPLPIPRDAPAAALPAVAAALDAACAAADAWVAAHTAGEPSPARDSVPPPPAAAGTVPPPTTAAPIRRDH